MNNKKYMKSKKNGGNVPVATDKRVLYVPVGCGKCMECRKQKARDWQVRLSEEIRHRKDGVFITFTFSDESLVELGNGIKGIEGYDLDNELARIGVRRFLERWRKKYGKSVRHWFVTELGQIETERIHIHGLIWTDRKKKLEIENIWGYGNVFLGNYVNEKTINYIVKYISKTDGKHKEYHPKMLVSPGIGKSYLNRPDSKRNVYNKDTNETYKTRQGVKLSLPVYYRNNIYTEDERELLWLEKLDKQERYVDGRKVCIKEGEDNYFAMLKVAQSKSKRLGYGDDKINWDLRKYENDKRNKLKLSRIEKVKFGK